MSPLFVEALKHVRQSEAASRLGLLARLRRRARLLAGDRWLLGRAERMARRASLRPGSCSVVFWPNEIGHVECLVPVARALARLGQTTHFVTSKPSVFARLAKAGEPAIHLRAVWGRSLREARRRGAERVRVLRSGDPETLASVEAVDAAAGLVAMRATVAELLPAVWETVTAVDLVLRKCGARVLVVGNDLTLEGRSGAMRARALGAKVACLMHGTVTGSPLHAYHLADQFLVFGEASQETVRGLGLSEKQSVIVGAPHLPDVPAQTGRIHPALEARLGLVQGEPWVLVATSGPGHSVSLETHRRLVAALSELSARHPQLKLVAKLHRKDRPAYYAEAVRHCPGSRLQVVPPDMPGLPDHIFEWLQGCPLLLTGASASAVDAMVLGVPVLSVDLGGELDDVDFIREGATLHVRDLRALEATLLEALAQPDGLRPVCARAQTYLHRAFAARGAEAAEQAARAIRALLVEAPPLIA